MYTMIRTSGNRRRKYSVDSHQGCRYYLRYIITTSWISKVWSDMQFFRAMLCSNKDVVTHTSGLVSYNLPQHITLSVAQAGPGGVWAAHSHPWGGSPPPSDILCTSAARCSTHPPARHSPCLQQNQPPHASSKSHKQAKKKAGKQVSKGDHGEVDRPSNDCTFGHQVQVQPQAARQWWIHFVQWLWCWLLFYRYFAPILLLWCFWIPIRSECATPYEIPSPPGRMNG